MPSRAMGDQQNRRQDTILCDGCSADNLDRVILQPCALGTYLETACHVSGTAWSSAYTSEIPGQARYRILQQSEFPKAHGGFSDVFWGTCAKIPVGVDSNDGHEATKVRISCY
jgi:hypothetical protein